MRPGVPSDVFPPEPKTPDRGPPRAGRDPMFFLTRAKRYFPLFRGLK